MGNGQIKKYQQGFWRVYLLWKKRIIRSGKELELLKYFPDYYLIAERVNRILEQLRVGIQHG